MKKCEVCTYLKQYEDDITINYINGLISKNTPYEQIKEECSKKPIPVGNLFERHKKDCLKDFISKEKNTRDDLDSIGFKTVATKNSADIKYTDYKDAEDIDIKRTLKNKLLHISAKLIDHVEHDLMDFSKTKINVKDTVLTLKTTIDLMNFTVELPPEDNLKKLPRFFIQVRNKDGSINNNNLYESNNKLYKRIDGNEVEEIKK